MSDAKTIELYAREVERLEEQIENLYRCIDKANEAPKRIYLALFPKSVEKSWLDENSILTMLREIQRLQQQRKSSDE